MQSYAAVNNELVNAHDLELNEKGSCRETSFSGILTC